MDAQRTCSSCRQTEEGWEFDRCPNCGEMAGDSPTELVEVFMTREEWTRVALALSVAHNDYLRTARCVRHPNDPDDPTWIKNANTAARLCNVICDKATLPDIFRVEQECLLAKPIPFPNVPGNIENAKK